MNSLYGLPGRPRHVASDLRDVHEEDMNGKSIEWVFRSLPFHLTFLESGPAVQHWHHKCYDVMEANSRWVWWLHPFVELTAVEHEYRVHTWHWNLTDGSGNESSYEYFRHNQSVLLGFELDQSMNALFIVYCQNRPETTFLRAQIDPLRLGQPALPCACRSFPSSLTVLTRRPDS